ncbi:MAG: DinB family protein [Tepidiformaceae bacterium]
MSRTLLDDAFAHHVWATVRLIDACLALNPAQLDALVPATERSLLATMRHVVAADSFDLFAASGERGSFVRADQMGLAALGAAMEECGAGWTRLLREGLEADAVVRETDPDDGFQRDAPMGIRLAQALHHGSDHRSQISSVLTTLGVHPPTLDVFSFGLWDGRVREMPAKS